MLNEILVIEDMVGPFGAPNCRAIRRWAAQEGKLPPGKKVGNEIIWLKEEVLAWLSSQGQVANQKLEQVAGSLAASKVQDLPQATCRGRGRPRKLEVLARSAA